MIDNRKFNKVLTVVLIIIGVAILVVLGFVGYDIIQSYYINKGAKDVIDVFDKEVNQMAQNEINTTNNNDVSDNSNTYNEKSNTENVTNNSSNSNNSNHTSNISQKKNTISLKYKGFDVMGKIEIPKTNVNYPVLSKATISSMEVSVGITYGPGLNEIGNTVIMGHNYRNNALFSKNNKLDIGDIIYITDLSGNRVKYTIYNKYETTSTDFDYATRDTAGKREISLASCTDDSSSRLIIWASAD